MAKTDSGKFAKKLQKILEKYGDDVTDATRRMVKKAGNEAKNRLRKESPVRKTVSVQSYTSPPGGYARGWATGEYKEQFGGAEITVHNRYKPGLAHLLEKGHEGNRITKYTFVKPITHIKPVEKEVKDEFEKELKKLLGKNFI